MKKSGYSLGVKSNSVMLFVKVLHKKHQLMLETTFICINKGERCTTFASCLLLFWLSTQCVLLVQSPCLLLVGGWK